jgi:N-acetylglutamate synthase-like GNAT family acetyltransferase
VYVTPEYRRRGIGDALCQRIEAEATRLGQSELSLFTEDREQFYAKRGWEVTQRPRYRGRDVVVMRKGVE